MSGHTGAEELITKKYRKRSRSGELFHRVMGNKGAMAGLIIISLILLAFAVSLFAISYEAMTATSAKNKIMPPSVQFPFGTDTLGRNIFLRVAYGTRYSLAIGFGTTIISFVLGVFIGAVAGYYGGMLESFIMRISEILTSVPSMLFTMVMMMTFGQGLGSMVLAMGINGIPAYIRISRASVLRLRDDEYVEAAKATGISNLRIIFTEVLPNGMAPIIITLTTGIGMTILSAAGLSYLGFGIQPPLPEWGGLVSAGRGQLMAAPWVSLFPGLAVMFTVLSFNMLGDGLRDALDPKLKR